METKLKHKVGDRVRVKSLEWYNFNKDVHGDIYSNTELNVFVRDMAQYCGKVLNITKLNCDSYIVEGNIYSWLDWMLEDDVVTEEPVTEEKQEVEQQNQNTMETKKMTLQEAQDFVKNTKYIVFSEDDSRQLQEKLFEIGYEWRIGGAIVRNTEHPFLFVDNAMKITFAEKEAYRTFKESTDTYMQTDDILNIEIEKPKFDPNTLEDFQKVLVRNDDGEFWCLDFYDSYRYNDEAEIEMFYSISGLYMQCVPYNDETKHLKGTTDEAPDFYKVWK